VLVGIVAARHVQERLRVGGLPIDNLVTAGFQTDRAVLRLRLAAINGLARDGEPAEALEWFEILAGRMAILQEGGIGALLRSRPDASLPLAELIELVASLDGELAAAPDDMARLRLIERAGAPLATASTRVAIAAVQVSAELRTRWDRKRTKTELRLALLIMGAVLAAMLLCALLVLQSRRLDRARLAAEAASEAKTTFLANMSHELRTPLNGVLGMLDLLADEALPPAARDRAATARGSAQQLLGLIGDILDITKLEAGRVELERVPFDLGALLRRAVSTFEASAASKGVALTLRLDDGADRWLLGDPTRLAQMVNNLVANAVKFTSEGGVGVTARATAGADGRVALQIAVQDTGIGIAPEALARLFEKFTQADASTTRRYGGTGLGLAICRQLAELMGGTIDLASRPGAGTTATLRLTLPVAATPAPVPAAALPQAASAVAGRASLVLLVEDDRVGRQVASAMLRRLGAEVETAQDGREAVARAAARRFDLILMDIQMPEMNGLDAARLIRASGGPNARTRIVALTANVFREDVERSREAGMDGHVPKPVSRAALAALLAPDEAAAMAAGAAA
jgi:signal transduction histidine kinase/ActR/RegA family two-component response regulator